MQSLYISLTSQFLVCASAHCVRWQFGVPISFAWSSVWGPISKSLALRGLDPSYPSSGHVGSHLYPRHHNWSPAVTVSPLLPVRSSLLSSTQQGTNLLLLHHAESHNCLSSILSSFFYSLITLHAGGNSAAPKPGCTAWTSGTISGSSD